MTRLYTGNENVTPERSVNLVTLQTTPIEKELQVKKTREEAVTAANSS